MTDRTAPSPRSGRVAVADSTGRRTITEENVTYEQNRMMEEQ